MRGRRADFLTHLHWPGLCRPLLSDWNNTRIARGDVSKEVARLKHRLIVHPVVLSAGLSLFAEATDLKPLGSKAFPAGAITLTYGGA